MPLNGIYDVIYDVDAAVPGVGQAQGGGWERFKVLSSRSVSAAKVCGEVLRDKSTGEVRVDGHSNGRRGHRDASGSQMGCCVVRAM